MTGYNAAAICCDAHVEEPYDLWSRRAARFIRDRVPRPVRTDDGRWIMVIENAAIGLPSTNADYRIAQAVQAVQDSDAGQTSQKGSAWPHARLDLTQPEGVDGQVIYPTIGLHAWSITHKGAGRAACVIYNNWTTERLRGSARIKFAALIPTWNLEMALEEVDRMAGVDSVAGMLLPLGQMSANLARWEPLWRAIAETGKPAMLHRAIGDDAYFDPEDKPLETSPFNQRIAGRTAAHFACSGVLDRHPSLHIVLAGLGAGWIAQTSAATDERYRAHQHSSGLRLHELPGHYIRHQIHATLHDEPAAIDQVALTGTDCLLWGNGDRCGHGTSANAGALDSLLKDADPLTAAAIRYRNATRLFGFSEAARIAQT